MPAGAPDLESAPGAEPRSRRQIGDLPALLRGVGVTADVRQREAIRDVFATADKLDEPEIADVITVILAHSADQQRRVREIILDWLKQGDEALLTFEPLEAAKVAAAQNASAEEEEKEPSLRQLVVVRVMERRDWPLWLILAPLGASGLGAIAIWGVPDVGSGLGAALPAHIGGVASETWAAVLGGAIAALPLGYVCIRIADAVSAWREQRRLRRTRRDHALPEGPSLFDFESVGGRAFRFFERRDLQEIARAVPRRRGDTPSRRLDPIRSVSATALAGLPTLLYRALPEPWPIIVLADRRAPGRQWSDLPADLAGGLASCGLQVLLGSFPGRLDRFDVEELGRVDLTGLMSQDALLLLVGDGSRLSHRGPDIVALRRLADGGRAIWIDEREELRWEPRADAPVLAGLPVCPAVRERIFETLRALGREPVRQVPPERGRSAWPSAGLGDALGWAAACSMVQPIGVALADELRRRFFPHLAPIAFGRLVALRGASLRTEGLRFDDRLLIWLRSQFALRFSEERQNAILDAILTAVKNSGASLPENSLAHQTWRWHYARVLLDRDPDKALGELATLKDTVLDGTIRRDLEKVCLPGLEAGRSTVIPMLRLPKRAAEFAGRIAAMGLPPLGGDGFSTWTLRGLPSHAIGFDRPAVIVAAASEGAGKFITLLEDGSLHLSTALDGGTTLLRGPTQISGADTLLSISPSGEYVACAGPAGPPAIFTVGPPVVAIEIDMAAHKEGLSYLLAGVAAMAFHPSEPQLALVLKAGGLLMVDLPKATPTDFAFPELRFTAVAVSASGGILLATDDRRIAWRGAVQERHLKNALQVDFDIRGLAVGPNNWPLVVAGENRLVVFTEPPPGSPATAPPERRGPWPAPAGKMPLLQLIEDNNVVAVLTSERLALVHLHTGLDLLKDEGEAQSSRPHAALAASANLALFWGEGRRQLLVETFDNRRAEAEVAPTAEDGQTAAQGAPVAA